MLKSAHQSRSSLSLSSAALLISILASLGACATLDQSPRQSMSPATRSASAAQPSESFFGYVAEPTEHPRGPSFFGYQEEAAIPTGPSFFGYVAEPTEPPRGPSFFDYREDLVARSAPAGRPSREPQAPVAVKR